MWLFLMLLLVSVQYVVVVFRLTYSLTFGWFEPHRQRIHCVVSSSKIPDPLLSTGLTQEDSSGHDTRSYDNRLAFWL